jgi:uncharacterized protein YbaR (Trm112 family)
MNKYKKLTTEEFIEKAKEAHGDKYDYSITNYIGSGNDVDIICKIHGKFSKRAKRHLEGSGCKKCLIDSIKISKEDFIERANKVHNNKYDYSKVEYINARICVKLICLIHKGFEFFQTPNSHLRGSGCPKCIGRNLTTEEFIEEAIKVHGNKYDYSKANCVGVSKLIEIICPKEGHGSFWQKASNHLNGAGCNRCAGNIKLTTEEFIEYANKTHNNKYDYSKVLYVDMRTKVEIYCPKHDKTWWQKPGNHLNGKGCSECGNEKIKEKQRLTTDEFIRRAVKMHNDKFDYSKSLYMDHNTKIEIICNICKKSFLQSPDSHVRGCGCPHCYAALKMSKEEFIEKAKKIHNNKYDYSKINYVNIITKLDLFCPIEGHGPFQKAPNYHLMGRGCPVCDGNVRLTRETFIEKANEIHNNKYNYNNVNYINTSINIEIICHKHGSWYTKPLYHLKGGGCPSCSKIISNKEIAWLNFIKLPNDKLHRQAIIKISGKSFKVDGFDPETITVYEFFGDYWHGNPKRFDQDKIFHGSKTFGDLYKETMERVEILKSTGYNVVYIWESDWDKQNKDNIKEEGLIESIENQNGY